jgi:hypothetical protein
VDIVTEVRRAAQLAARSAGRRGRDEEGAPMVEYILLVASSPSR